MRRLLRGRSAMANALIVHKNSLPQSQKTFRAAQYVRMSTDYQRYSIENQAAVIAAYAQAHDLSIVRTYRDEGESGLKLKNRPGLIMPTSITSWSTTLAVGGVFRTSMRAPTTSSSANRPASRWRIVRSNST